MAVTIVTYAVITLVAHMVIIARTMTRLASTIITVVTHTVKNITMYNSHKPIHWPLFVLGKYKIRQMYGSTTRIVITVHDPTVITAKCAGKESTTKTSSKLSWYRTEITGITIFLNTNFEGTEYCYKLAPDPTIICRLATHQL